MTAAKKLATDSSINETTSTLEILRKCPLFAYATDSDIEKVASHLVQKKYAKGDPVFIDNDPSNEVYFVKKGSVQVVKQVGDTRAIRRVRMAQAGEHLAEFSVLTHSKHQSSAFALEESILLKLPGEVFLELLNDSPQMAHGLLKVLAELNHKNIGDSTPVQYFKEEDLQLTPEMIKILPISFISKYKVFPIKVKGQILSIAMALPVNMEFFDEFAKLENGYSINLNIISDNDFEALKNPILNFYWGRDTGLELKSQPSSSETQLGSEAPPLKDLLQFTLIFSQLPEDLIEELLPYFSIEEYKAGESVFEPGTESDKLYLIESGRVGFAKKLDAKTDVTSQIASFSTYDTFAELSLILGKRHSLQAKAIEDSRIYVLEKIVFEQLLRRSDFTVPLCIVLARHLQTTNATKGEDLESIDSAQPDVDIKTLIPKSVIETHKAVPLRLENNLLTIGLVGQETEELLIVFNKFLSDYRIHTEQISEKAFQDLLVKVPDEEHATLGSDDWTRKPQKLLSVKSIVTDPTKGVDQIMKQAITARASDVHFERIHEGLMVRYRVDGILRRFWETLPHDYADQITSRIKVLAQMDISEKRLPQDGLAQFKFGPTEVHGRISTVPTRYGEKIVIRLAKMRDAIIPINLLAPEKAVLSFLNMLIKSQQGLFLVTGPTGSGKTTTLYSILGEINKQHTNIVTIEEPVELEIPGINQIEVKKNIGLNFDVVLKHCLRQDPDVMLIGEIRDHESMHMAFEAALTGHLVLATLHSGSTLDIVPRLKELGGSTSNIATTLIGVMSQRLIRSICPDCKKQRPIVNKERYILEKVLPDTPVPPKVAFGEGCVKCNYVGYRGRIPVFEFWKKTDSISNALYDDAGTEDLVKTIQQEGLQTLGEYGLRMALNGKTTIEEVAIRLLPTLT
jgi:type IV pilus assembly protein PilB